MSEFKISVFTPTYNRAALLHRVFDSLLVQTRRNFEWIVIDDGSDDNTSEIVKDFIERADFPIVIVKKENGGKAAAINDALELARGEWFAVFDSDDWCSKSAMEALEHAAESLKLERDEYCAISVLKAYEDGVIVGDDYSGLEGFGYSYIDRLRLGVKGDKWEVLRTDVHKKYKYDLAPGERYMAPSYSWIQMGVKYKTLFINQVLMGVEYQSDGISNNNIIHRAGSPASAMRYYETLSSVAPTLWLRCRAWLNYSRFAWHAGARPKLWPARLMSPLGWWWFKGDLKKIKRILTKQGRRLP